jgi:hypothetical protein
MYGRNYWNVLAQAYALCHTARQIITKQNDFPTSRPATTRAIGGIDLGWREPEEVKEKKKKKKDRAVDVTDSTDASERFEASKVRLSSALLSMCCIER